MTTVGDEIFYTCYKFIGTGEPRASFSKKGIIIDEISTSFKIKDVKSRKTYWRIKDNVVKVN